MKTQLIIILMLGIILSACSTTTENTQIANPASTYCVEKGGELIMNETSLGTQGLCKINDVVVDEWDYFRANNEVNNKSTENNSDEMPTTVDITNESVAYCIEKGGEAINDETRPPAMRVCKINGEIIDLYDFFRANHHVCSSEEKAAEICTMEYMPVCGNDNVTYGNKCSACSAKIDSWISGEC